MHVRIAFAVAALVAASACDSLPTAPPAARSANATTASATTTADPGYMGPSNQCYGSIILGIARTWSWPHDGRLDSLAPPGAVAWWLQEYGSNYYVTSVRQLQAWFCSE